MTGADIRQLQRTWERLGRDDPMWASLARPEDQVASREEWDEEEFFSTGTVEIADVMTYLESLGLPGRRRRALDFGCGVGRLTRPLAAEFDQVIGVDIAESMVNAARGLNESIRNCEFRHNPSPDLACFDSRSFDFVYSSRTLQHMPPELTQGYIAEFMRLVSPDGLVIFQFIAGMKPEVALAGTGTMRKLRKIQSNPRGATRLIISHLRGRTFQMHPVARHEVVDVLTSAGGRLLEVQANDAAGPSFQSYRVAVAPS